MERCELTPINTITIYIPMELPEDFTTSGSNGDFRLLLTIDIFSSLGEAGESPILSSFGEFMSPRFSFGPLFSSLGEAMIVLSPFLWKTISPCLLLSLLFSCLPRCVRSLNKLSNDLERVGSLPLCSVRREGRGDPVGLLATPPGLLATPPGFVSLWSFPVLVGCCCQLISSAEIVVKSSCSLCRSDRDPDLP